MSATPKKSRMVGRVHRQNVLAEIKKHIGKPCPTNDEIGQILGGLHRNMVSGAIMALCAQGVLERKGTRSHRILRVVATGEETLPGILKYPVLSPRERSLPITAPEFPQHIRFDDACRDPDATPFPRFSGPDLPPARKDTYIPERFRNAKACE